MATKMTRKVVREVETSRGTRLVEMTPHGVVVREKRRKAPPPIPWEALEDLGLKLLAKGDGHPIPRPRR